MQRLGAFALVVVASLASIAPADAGDGRNHKIRLSSEGAINVEQAATGGPSAGTPSPPLQWVYTVGLDPTGQPCTQLLQVPTSAVPTGALPIQFGTGPTFVTPLFCPAAVSPAVLAYSYWAEAK